MSVSIIESVDLLRGRFHRLRCLRPIEARDYATIASEMDISKPTLYRFAHGQASFYGKTLPAIEAWCNRQEIAHGNLF